MRDGDRWRLAGIHLSPIGGPPPIAPAGKDPALADLHPHRERGASAYVWHLFDRLDDLRPILRL